MQKRVLESERLYLKPLAFSELKYIRNNEIDKIETSIELEAISDSIKAAISKKLEKMQKINEDVNEWYTYWLIIDKNSKKGMGFIGFKGLPDENGYSEVGYSLSSYYRKKGLMTEALEELIKWAYTFKTCKGVTAKKVLKTNIGSNKVLKNCNFKLISSNEYENNYILMLRK